MFTEIPNYVFFIKDFEILSYQKTCVDVKYRETSYIGAVIIDINIPCSIYSSFKLTGYVIIIKKNPKLRFGQI
jgi:hypothetical protein